MKPRLQTFLVHLALSAVVATSVIILVFFVWYPAPLHKATGITQIFLLLLSIDITLGPLLTLLTYKPTAGFLKFDLPIIVVLQVVALTYGMHTVFVSRPAFVVFSRGMFYVVRELDVDLSSAKKAADAGNVAARAGYFSPQWVASIQPTDPNRLNEVFFSNTDWNRLPESYKPLAEAKDKILTKAKPLSELRAKHAQDESLKGLDLGDEATTKWLPLYASSQDMVVLINANSGEVLKVIDARP